MEKGLTNLAGAIMVVGLATISAAYSSPGWGLLAIIVFFFYGWQTESKTDGE